MRVAVVGAGAMGRLHARAIARRAENMRDCDLRLVVDRHSDRAESVAAEFGGRPCEPGSVDWSDVDCAIIAIPTHGHVSLAEECMENGLDVLVEKPIAPSVSEAQGLANVADHTERILQVGHTEWYNPGWRAALAVAGRPRKIEVDRLNPRTERGLDLDVVQDFMLHDLDWVTRIVGEEIASLTATGRAVRGTDLDEAEVELRFTSGTVARLRASRVYEGRKRTVRIDGRDGIARADLSSGRLIEPVSTAPSDAEKAALPDIEPLDAQWADFLRACAERKAPANDARVGLTAIDLVERVRAAIGIRAEASRDADDSAVRR